MSPEQMDKLCECLRRAQLGALLVPWREVHSEVLTIAAPAVPRRVSVKLRPEENTRAYVAVISPRPSAFDLETEPAAVLLRIMHGGGPADAHAELLAGNGRIVPAGGDYTHAIPAWGKEWHVDLLGVEQGATGTPTEVVVDFVVYEMVPAMRGERC